MCIVLHTILSSLLLAVFYMLGESSLLFRVVTEKTTAASDLKDTDGVGWTVLVPSNTLSAYQVIVMSRTTFI